MERNYRMIIESGCTINTVHISGNKESLDEFKESKSTYLVSSGDNEIVHPNGDSIIRIFQSPLEPIIDFVKIESDHFKDLLFELTYLNSEKGVGGFVRMKGGKFLKYSRHEANINQTQAQIQAYNEFADNYFLRYRPQEYLLKIRQQPTRELYDEVKAILNLAWKNDDLMTQEVLFQLQDAVGSLALSIAEDENSVEDLIKSFPWAFRSAIQQWEGEEKRR